MPSSFKNKLLYTAALLGFLVFVGIVTIGVITGTAIANRNNNEEKTFNTEINVEKISIPFKNKELQTLINKDRLIIGQQDASDVSVVKQPIIIGNVDNSDYTRYNMLGSSLESYWSPSKVPVKSQLDQSVAGWFYKFNEELAGMSIEEKDSRIAIEFLLFNNISDGNCDQPMLNLTAPPALKIVEPLGQPCPKHNVGVNTDDPLCHLDVHNDLCVRGNVFVDGTITGTFNISFNESCWRCESATHCPAREQNYEYPPVNGFVGSDIDLVFSNRGTGAFARSDTRTLADFGDCRGINAFDMQLKRLVSSQVGSGDFSVIGNGDSNTAADLMTLVGNGLGNLIRNVTHSSVLNGIENAIEHTFGDSASTRQQNIIGSGFANRILHVTVVDSGTEHLVYNSIINGNNNTIVGVSPSAAIRWNTILNGELDFISESEHCLATGASNSIGASTFSNNYGSGNSISACTHADVHGFSQSITAYDKSYVFGSGNVITSGGFSKMAFVHCETCTLSTDTTHSYNSMHNGFSHAETSVVQSTIGNGATNILTNGTRLTIGNGFENKIESTAFPGSDGSATDSSISSGSSNTIVYGALFPASTTFGYDLISSGSGNIITAGLSLSLTRYSANIIYGGFSNTINSSFLSSIFCDGCSIFDSEFATVVGDENTVSSSVCAHVGGFTNAISSSTFGHIHNGQSNVITDAAVYNTIDNGQNNSITTVTSTHNTIDNGENNRIENSTYVFLSGKSNLVTGGTNQFLYGEGLVGPENLGGAGVSHFTAFGKFNTFAAGPTNASGRVFVIGNGASAGARSNLFSIASNGNVYTSFGGSYISGGADFNEWFPRCERSQLPIGTSVRITDKGCIRQAIKGDQPHGVVNVHAGFSGNAAEEHWHGKYLYHNEGYQLVPRLNPAYDPSKPYLPRSERPDEWAPVALLGQVEVLDDEPVSSQWISMAQRPTTKFGRRWYMVK